MHEMHSVDVPGDEFMDEVGSSDHPLKNGDRCRSPYEAWRAGFATAAPRFVDAFFPKFEARRP